MQTAINIMVEYHKQTKNDMRDHDLEQKIHEWICKIYKAKYKGRLEVTQEDGVYTLTLGLPSPDMPTNISIQTDDKAEFLKYIFEELRTRNYMRVYFYSTKRTDLKNETIKKGKRV